MSDKISWKHTEKIINSLKNNALLITSTDTIPGFLANTTELNFDKLSQIKGGRDAKPYIILISDAQKLDHFIEQEQLTPEIKKLINKCWPGPLTVIFKAKKDLPDFLKSKQNTVAIRCPAHPELLEVLKHFDGLFSTSANKSNSPAPKTIQEIDPDIAAQVKYLIDDEQQHTNTNQPSTIIDVCTEQPYIIRHGAYSQQELERILGKQIMKRTDRK